MPTHTYNKGMTADTVFNEEETNLTSCPYRVYVIGNGTSIYSHFSQDLDRLLENFEWLNFFIDKGYKWYIRADKEVRCKDLTSDDVERGIEWLKEKSQ